MPALLQGDQDEAIALYKRALEIDPLSLSLQYNLGVANYASNRPEEALEYFDKALAMSPGLAPAEFKRALVILMAGDAATALAEFQALADEPRVLQGSALAYFELGQEAESAAAIDEMEERFLKEDWHVYAAEVRAYRGEIDRAFELLDLAYENDRHPSLLNVPSSPLFATLHSDPRWAAINKKIGFVNAEE